MRILLPFFLFVLPILFSLDTSAQFNPNLTYGTVNDVDGNTYKTIQIGSQVWFAENLRTAKFNNGDSIPHVPDANDWRAIWNNGNPTSKPAWCYFLNNASNNTTRGKLYNWYAIADNRNICPTGWHVPTDLEFTTLIGFLDSAYTPEISFPVMTQQSALAGGKLKSTGTQFWQSPNDGATNSSGFSAIWGGHRSSIGSTDMFVNNGIQGVWWTSSDTTIQHGWHRSMGNFGPNINKSWFEKSNGASVRCLKNQELPLLPVVFTLQAKTTSFTSAVSGGKVVNDGGSSVTERGICWSTSPLPTINQTKTSSGNGMGNYGSSIANIQESTIYYVRAYATNSVGTSYGNQVTFKTGSSAPSAHSCGASDVHNSNLTYGTVTDQQGNLYKTIQIGNQTWMAENLRTSVYTNGDPIANVSASVFPAAIGETGYYKNDTTFGCPYGRLYNWYAINDNRRICPAGWHIPTDGEWITLETFLGGKLVAGSKMKSTGTTYWPSPNTDATNSSGFSGLPGRMRTSWAGATFEAKGVWWSLTEAASLTSWGRYLNFESPEVARLEFDKFAGLSVRCVKDAPIIPPSLTTVSLSNINNNSATSGGTILSDGGAAITEKGICWSTSPEPTIANNKLVAGSGTSTFTSNLTGLTISTVYYVRSYAVNSTGTGYGPVISFSTTPHSTGVHTCGAVNVHNSNLTYGSVTDQQGNAYKTIQIGTQTWMAENLKTSVYRNGDPILHVPGNQWGEIYLGAWCHFNNDPARECPYGKLYNFRAVADNRNICPSGWHVPTRDEVFALMKFLDPGSYSISGVYQVANAGTKMRNTGTQYWDNPNNATNSSGFSALPAGSRSVYGSFFNPGFGTNFWTFNPFNSGSSWTLRITNEDEYTSSRINITKITGNLVVAGSSGVDDGYSVRCMRDNDQGLTPPVLVTNSVSSVASTTATSGGNITADGGTAVIERGVCWNTSPNPTVVNNKLVSGSGLGTFTSNLTSLAAGTTYYLRAYAINSAGVAYGNEVTFTTTTSPLPTNIDFVNLQFPGSITAPQVGFPIAVNVYAQVYTAGVTEAPGAGAGITAWIGYSSSNTNPATWTNWVPATFNTQSGNNDEYVATIGNDLVRGTYYYASRFQRNGGPFYYGGYNASGGNIWNGTSFLSGVLNIVEAPGTIDYVNLQFPGAASINQGGSADIYAQVYTKDLTEAPGAGGGISAWIGISTRNLQPSSFTTWIPATFHKQVGNNDEYKAAIGSDLPPGTYYYASRFQRNNGPLYYGGYSSTGGNSWNGTSFVNGVLTVNSSGPTSPHTCPGVSVHNPTQTYGVMSDQQGNQYKTIKIGNQEWMAENLKTTVYRNGNPIPGVDVGSYNNESSKDCPYGKYYSGFAITDFRNVCPIGWHVPFDAEWNTLITTLDPAAFINCSDCIQSGTAGAAMKSTGVQYWSSPNTGATNSSGMSVIGGGQRFNNGTYGDLNNNAFLWAAPNPGSDVLTTRNLSYDKTSIYREITTDKRNGYSVRCMKDNPQGGPTTNTGDLNLIVVKEQIYPNPNNGQFDLNIQTGTLSLQAVKIKIMDAYGKLVNEFVTQNNRGHIRHRFNGAHLPSGLYTVQYSIGQQSRVIKMIVQH